MIEKHATARSDADEAFDGGKSTVSGFSAVDPAVRDVVRLASATQSSGSAISVIDTTIIVVHQASQ